MHIFKVNLWRPALCINQYIFEKCLAWKNIWKIKECLQFSGVYLIFKLLRKMNFISDIRHYNFRETKRREPSKELITCSSNFKVKSLKPLIFLTLTFWLSRIQRSTTFSFKKSVRKIKFAAMNSVILGGFPWFIENIRY